MVLRLKQGFGGVAASVVASSVLVTVTFSLRVQAHELSARVGGYRSQEGESRNALKVNARAALPPLASGEITSDLVVSSGWERYDVQGESYEDNEYMKSNFSGGRRIDRSASVDSEWVFAKRTDLMFGYGVISDAVTTSESVRGSVGQWLLGDQLRLGLSFGENATKRPAARILDTDYTGIDIRPHVRSRSLGLNVKGILNPTLTLSTDYTRVMSSERPVLHAWTMIIKKYLEGCDCAIHGEVGRVINIGALNTNMADGELTGSQWSLAFLPTLWNGGHARLAYRYAREDEFTRAYGDHLVYGSDQYTFGLSQDFSSYGLNSIWDLGVTRYIRNRKGTALALESGLSMKF